MNLLFIWILCLKIHKITTKFISHSVKQTNKINTNSKINILTLCALQLCPFAFGFWTSLISEWINSNYIQYLKFTPVIFTINLFCVLVMIIPAWLWDLYHQLVLVFLAVTDTDCVHTIREEWSVIFPIQ